VILDDDADVGLSRSFSVFLGDIFSDLGYYIPAAFAVRGLAVDFYVYMI
jgi:hypothetical protein